MEPILDIQKLTKRYGPKAALDNVSFSIAKGSCFGLLGPNGAGKSTTMKILTGILSADSGSVHVFGINAFKQQRNVQRQVGYVPQEITLYDKLSANDNLEFFGRLYGIKGQLLKKRIHDVLLETGLLDRAKDPVKSFSGGMKRRINIACALLHQPKLLILDEPTVGIDPQSRNHIFEMIRHLRDNGVTIIYSTHYMEEVEVLCDDIAIIDQGKVIAQGTLDELFASYAQKAVFVEAEGPFQPDSIHAIKKSYPRNHGWVLETDQPIEVMKTILDAQQSELKLKAIEMIRPSLEDVFLSLTGTRLRD
ncbi:ABC transporter ATP-binding protein [Sporolactobacillus laevolacticus]|uniref:ABC transporter ATP-binding protein n=1 Tax=Sporolactobacillus laevolacticus DSM 442 TaxID=1395513 RepID=V6IYJ4_9BACL|nr:ABC transporter ATP-binding protein [Sporolactobacillus laevolacticus]EST11806.1 ABC transporter ATP-binding protein [Sporolactobacillus laevolacticus DSM 442]